MQIEVLNNKGEKTGRNVDLPADIFDIEPNDHCIYLSVKQYLAAQRLGTHKTKSRGEVRGSTRKLHRQKGTGGSRKGSIRNPIYKGGGIVGGPTPHKYDFKLNKKVKDLAKMSALTYKVKEDCIIVVENLSYESPKTKEVDKLLKALNVQGKKVLFVTADLDENFYLSARNLNRVKTTVLSDIHTYDILDANVLVFSEEAIQILNEDDLVEA
ncbi:MAG TPA: 50S ribosomal protein L4 [Chitinophagaceae bacterium]|nr:50S ribosomal protein L4 [Chitinophagaceae bacterium]